MAIKIEMMRCFQAVADRGNLASAAEALGRTPSAVSMMLSHLEDEIGAPLFEAPRKSRLTPLGRMILTEVRAALQHFDRRVRAIESMARADVGLVRLAVTPSVAAAVLPAIVAAFCRAHPSVQIEMRDMDSASAIREIRAERADIAVATAGSATDDMTCRPLFDDAFGLVCHSGHPLAGRARFGWRDLVDETFIANGLCRLIADPEFAPIVETARLAVPNTTSLLALVRAGLGVSVLPRLAVPANDADLAFIAHESGALRREIHLVTPPHRHLPPAARAFCEAIVKACAGTPVQRD